MAEELCLPVGTCSQKYIVNDYELEARTYSLEESRLLRALSYENALMIRGNYITVVPDVKDKQRMYREDFKTQYQSKATGGRGAKDCGPFMPKGKYVNSDRYLSVKYLYNEAAVCYKQLIGTFKQRLLRRGANESELNTALNEMILLSMIRDNNIQTDKLIWHGDYGSEVEALAHYDGLVKIAFQALSGAAAWTADITIANLAAADHIEGRFGGVLIDVPFDTDNDTTVANLGTVFAGFKSPIDGSALFTVTVNANVITLEANSNGVNYDLELVVTQGDGINSCGKANTPGTGTLQIDETEAVGDAPHSINYTAIDSTNVLDELKKLKIKISEADDELDEISLLNNPNFYVHVSDHVYNMVEIALTTQTAAFASVNSPNFAQLRPYGLPLVRQPYLKGSVMFATLSDNIFFGTDLESDLGNTKQWINEDCQEVRLRNETMQGVQIDRLEQVVTNLSGGPFVFKSAQPEGVQ